MFVRFMVLVALVFAPLPAFAWGTDGHRIVCAIAWEELKAPTRKKVEDLLGIKTRDEFADSCNWADEYRGGHPETGSWHYVDVPIGASKVEVDRDCKEPRSCVVIQIERDLETLRGTGATEDKAMALKFLAHFVGDVHQPLHVSYAEDRGGNSIKGEFMGHATNLHAVWDTGMIETEHRPWQEIASSLHTRVSNEIRRAWIESKPLDWANESLAVALAPSTKYQHRFIHFNLGALYEHDELPIVHDRLSRAGVRLGALLNETLGDGK